MDTWHEKETTKKGDVGEEIVEQELNERGYTIYKPISSGRHNFDRLIMNYQDKGFLLEIKTKPRRIYHPDTGIDIKKYWQYKDCETNGMKIFIIFVDELTKSIYGNYLQILDKNSVRDIKDKKIYFQLSDMKTFRNLTDDEVKRIKEHSTINKKYIITDNEKEKE